VDKSTGIIAGPWTSGSTPARRPCTPRTLSGTAGACCRDREGEGASPPYRPRGGRSERGPPGRDRF